MSLEVGKEWLWIVDIILVILMAISLILALIVYLYPNPETYSANQLYLNENKEPLLEIAYNFTSEVFSAQSEIEVSIIARLNETLAEKQSVHPITVDSTLPIYFPTSTFSNPKFDEIGRHYISSFELKQDINDGLFKGVIKIKYMQEGEKCIIPFRWAEPNLPNCPENTEPIIYISSADSLYQFRNSKITFSLTLIFLAFTIILIRDFIKSMSQNRSLIKQNKVREIKNKEIKSNGITK